MVRVFVLLVVLALGFALAQTDPPGITDGIVSAINDSGSGILPAMTTLLGTLATVAVGWAILRTIRG